jgi:arginyl-tRNA synthetase
MLLIDKLIKNLKSEFPEIKEENLQFPSEFGDICCNICFSEARKKKTNPIKLAEETIKKLKLPKEFEKVEARNGYLNFFLNYKEIFDYILNQKIKKKGKEKIMIEFSNPNPCKAMHLGHARTTFLGDSVSRILNILGYNIIRANYYNDLGKQVAKEIVAFEKYGLKNKGKIDHKLAELYAKLHNEKNQEEINEKAQEILKDLETKGKYKSIWKKIVNSALKGFNETYNKLRIKFDVVFFESNFREKGKQITKKLLDKGFGFEDKGAIITDLEKYGIPNIVVLKKDCTGLYITADLALSIHKFEKYKLSKSIWVVGSDQKTYFRQLFKILELLNYKWYKNCIHMDYNLVNLKGKKMSSRAGKYILLDDLVNDLIKRGEKEVKKRGEKDQKKIKKIANKIGVGALKYEILKVERNKTIDFDPDKAISFEGNTGPYLQYMAVRCNSILRKIRKIKKEKIKEINEFEKLLLRKFLEFQIVVEKSGTQFKPNLICNYAYELATLFSKFYENCKVIGSENEGFRINLVRKTKEILETCLNLLGIEVPEKM